MRTRYLNTFALGMLISTAIFIAELSSSIGAVGTVAYVVVAIYFFWLADKKSDTILLAALSSVYLVVGFFIATSEIERSPTVIFNRFLSIPAIWLGVYCSIRFKEVIERGIRQKKQLSVITESAREGMVFLNKNFTIVQVNRRAGELFGYGKEELSGSRIEVLLPERHAEEHIDYLNQVFNDPKKRHLGFGKDILVRHKNGHEFPVKINLSRISINDEIFAIAFVLDVSEQKKTADELDKLNSELEERVKERTKELFEALNELGANNAELQKEIENRYRVEQELKKSRHLYKIVADNFPDGIIGILNREYRYIFADGTELANLGLDDNRGIGKHVFNHLEHSKNGRTERLLSDVFKGEKVLFEVKIKDQVYHVIAVPLHTDSNEINEILVVIRNITEMKMLETELRQALNKEKELGLLKSHFVTLASHEFRTPLSTIMSSIFLLENYTGQDYELKKEEHVKKIKRSVNLMTELLNDFLSLGKLEEGKVNVVYAETDIQSLLEDLIAEMELIKKTGQQIVIKVNKNPFFMTDKQLIVSILRNLLSNAIKYSPPESTIELNAEISDELLEINVLDQGIGIPDEEKHNIFKRFFRAQNASDFKGTGLGLHIVQKYARLLKGQVYFNNRPSGGTIFTVKIPITKNILNQEYEPYNITN